MKKEQLKSIASIAIVVAFVLISVWYVVDNFSEFTHLSLTHPLFLIPAALLMIINIYGTGVVIDLAIEPHGIKLTHKEAFGLAGITRFSNQFSPSYVGATIRAAYVKRKYGVSYSQFSSSFVISNLLQFMISGILTIATFFMLNNHSANNRPLITVAIVVVVFIGLLYLPISFVSSIFKKLQSRKGKLSNFANHVLELLKNYALVRRHPGLLPKTILWMVVSTLSIGVVFYLLYACLGAHISIIGALFVAALSGWSIIFAITPGSVGVREGLMAVAANIVGVPLSETLVVAVLLRLLMLVVSAALSLYFSPELLHTSLFKLNRLSRKN